jgi:hypothetical protein
MTCIFFSEPARSCRESDRDVPLQRKLAPERRPLHQRQQNTKYFRPGKQIQLNLLEAIRLNLH